jgi:hypothetical protein
MPSDRSGRRSSGIRATRTGGAFRECDEREAKSERRERRRVDSAGELSQLAEGAFEFSFRFTQQRLCARRVSPQSGLDELQPERDGDEALLRAVVPQTSPPTL